jgi:hypothetical protein
MAHRTSPLGCRRRSGAIPLESLNPAWKTGNYLNNLLCLREARSRGADDVVILNLAGEVTEASVSNIAFVRGGRIITPPLSAGILAGITRTSWWAGLRPPPGLRLARRRCGPPTCARWTSASCCRRPRTSCPLRRLTAPLQGRRGYGLSRLKAAFAAAARDYATGPSRAGRLRPGPHALPRHRPRDAQDRPGLRRRDRRRDAAARHRPPDPAKQWAGLAAVLKERRITEVVVGHPLNMDGTAGPKAREVEDLRRGFGGVRAARAPDRRAAHEL